MGLLFRWTCLKFETWTARDYSRVFFLLRDIDLPPCNSNHGKGRGIIQGPGEWGTTSIQAPGPTVAEYLLFFLRTWYTERPAPGSYYPVF